MADPIDVSGASPYRSWADGDSDFYAHVWQRMNHLALIRLGESLKTHGYRFTTVTPATHARVNGRSGNEWANSLQDVFGWSRPFQTPTIPVEILELMRSADVLTQHQSEWRSRVRASTLNEDIYFHSAYPTSNADAVFFGPDTYRFVTAINQHVAASLAPVRRAVDIGCGAGPGAIAVALQYPDAQVLAVDINDAALSFTKINASMAGAVNIQACHSNLLNDTAGNFDLIVANPPYLVDPGRRAYRHGGGMLGAGLSLAIIQAALHRLSEGGTLLLYTGAAMINGLDPFRQAVEQLLHKANFRWSYQETDPDIFGEELSCDAYMNADRIAAIVLTVTRLGGRR